MPQAASVSAACTALPPGCMASQSAIRALTRRAAETDAVNLAQGSCLLSPQRLLLEAAADAMERGYNSYTPFEGVPQLRQGLIEKYTRDNGLPLGSDNVVVTCGASGALECICATYLRPGDEVVMFEPMYPYHAAIVSGHGAVIRTVPMRLPDWTFAPEELAAALTPRTKLLVFANPHNPTGRVFSRAELECIAEQCRTRDVLAVVDEVYEYLTYDGTQHLSLAGLPGMFERTLTVSSAGKTFFVTGWRVGWLIGPADALAVIAATSDRLYVCAPAPLQHAVASGLRFPPAVFADQRALLDAKRRRLAAALADGGLTPHVPQGAYYILARCDDEEAEDHAMAERLMEEVGVAAVPASAFHLNQPKTGLLRFCFAVDDQLLDEACLRLARRSRTRRSA